MELQMRGREEKCSVNANAKQDVEAGHCARASRQREQGPGGPE